MIVRMYLLAVFLVTGVSTVSLAITPDICHNHQMSNHWLCTKMTNMHCACTGFVQKYELRLPSYLSTIGMQLPSLQANSVRLQPVSDIIAEYDVEHLAVEHFMPLKSYISF